MNEKHQLSESLVCPQCRSINDGATALGEQDQAPPRDGDCSVCLYCGEILEYTNMVTVLKIVSLEQLAERSTSQPQLVADLMRAQSLIIEMRTKEI